MQWMSICSSTNNFEVPESLHMASYYIRYDIPYLYQLPIIVIEDDKQTPIIQLVQKIITLKKLQHKFRELWRYYSRKFRNNYKSLGEILLDDKRAIQEGNVDKVWVSEEVFILMSKTSC